MKSIIILSILISSTFLAHAQKQERQFGPFEGLEVAGHYSVRLIKGTEGKLILEGDPEDLDQIETFIKGGILIIKQKNNSWFKSWKSGRVNITIPIEEVSEVGLSGSGSISANHSLEAHDFDVTLSGSGKIALNIEAQNIEGTLTGSGDLNLSGSAAEVNYQLTGSGDIKAAELKSGIAKATITGSGDIEMYSNNEIRASVTGSGDIFCYGNPNKQQIKTTGSGDIVIKD